MTIPPMQLPGKRGRPVGAKGYGGHSLIAKEMKYRGVDWKGELVEAYKAYREAYFSIPAAERQLGKAPDNTLIYFWTEILPYMIMKQVDKFPRGQKPSPAKKRVVSDATIAALKRMEGR